MSSEAYHNLQRALEDYISEFAGLVAACRGTHHVYRQAVAALSKPELVLNDLASLTNNITTSTNRIGEACDLLIDAAITVNDTAVIYDASREVQP